MNAAGTEAVTVELVWLVTGSVFSSTVSFSGGEEDMKMVALFSVALFPVPSDDEGMIGVAKVEESVSDNRRDTKNQSGSLSITLFLNNFKTSQTQDVVAPLPLLRH